MSARNWRECPKCLRDGMKAREARIARVKSQYGRIPPDEWAQLKSEAEEPLNIPDTLREDYEIAVDTSGLFTVVYRCSCDECEFQFTFKKTMNALRDS